MEAFSPMSREIPDRPRRNPETAFRALGDEGGLVVIPGRSEVKVVNPVGILVYRLLDGKHSIAEIVAQVTKEFDIGAAEAEADVQAFVGELADHGMLAEEEAKA